MQRLIDADALTNKCGDWYTEEGTEEGFIGCLKQLIDEQPAIDAVPARHGMFIGTEFDGYADGNPVYYEWKCSECGCIFEEEEPTYRYCPNCGARMDADE